MVAMEITEGTVEYFGCYGDHGGSLVSDKSPLTALLIYLTSFYVLHAADGDRKETMITLRLTWWRRLRSATTGSHIPVVIAGGASEAGRPGSCRPGYRSVRPSCLHFLPFPSLQPP